MLRYAMKTIARHLSNRKAERELYAMSDRDLEDMGISRYQIPYVVRGCKVK